MADLDDKSAAQTVKIAGASAAGVESNYADVNTERRLLVQAAQIGTATKTRPNVTNASSIILASNANRKAAYIANNSGASWWIELGSTAVASQGLPLLSGGIFFITADNLFTGDVYAIKNGATVQADVWEGTQ